MRLTKEQFRETVAKELARQASVNDAGYIGVTNATVQKNVDKIWKDFLPRAMGIVQAVEEANRQGQANVTLDPEPDYTAVSTPLLRQLIDRVEWLGELIIETEERRRAEKAVRKANKRKAK